MPVDWATENEELFRLLYPLVVDAGLDGARGGLGSAPLAGIDIDFGIINRRVEAWARSYTYALVSAINETSQTFLQETISAWVSSGQPLNVLAEQLATMFGPVRAEMISVTEVTRAFAQGNIEAWRESGVINLMQWNTANDDLVCEICMPLNGMTDGLDGEFGEAGGPPPAHVRCRCWLSPVVQEVAGA